ncbi:MAG TPA: phosphotransferase [Kofleriaceae bacterium]|nr:phosphotransferase [Kofleriaceae bacterium]
MLDAYGLAPVEAPRVWAGRVLRVPTATGDLAVKLFPAAEQHRARLEAALLAHLGAVSDPRYRVQTPLATSDGQPLFDGEDGLVLLTRWEPGAYKPYTEISADEWAALGRSLGALHARLDQAAGIALPARLSGIIRGRDLDAERATLERHRAAAVAKEPARAEALSHYFDARRLLLDERAERCRAQLPADPERPIHNDYNQYNYLFRDAGPPLILDWERAIGAPREYEVVRCLNQLPLVAPELARRFIAGYLEARPLGAAQLVWAVDAALTEHAVKHWPIDAWLAGAPDADARLAATLETVETVAAGRAALDWFFHEIAGTLG